MKFFLFFIRSNPKVDVYIECGVLIIFKTFKMAIVNSIQLKTNKKIHHVENENQVRLPNFAQTNQALLILHSGFYILFHESSLFVIGLFHNIIQQFFYS